MARRHFKPWKPYVPPKPPAGSYDPALNAQRAAAQRGLGDVTQDVETAGTRAGVDYGLGREAIGRTLGRGEEDYQRSTGLLQQAYQRQGVRQQESANAAGVLNGGALLQAAAKRAANQQTEQQGLDIGIRRERENASLAQGELDLGYQRGGIDRATTLSRAGRENEAFGLDTDAQIAFQASQSGYVPPGRGEPGGQPLSQHVTPGGRPYEWQRGGDWLYKINPKGQRFGQRRRVR